MEEIDLEDVRKRILIYGAIKNMSLRQLCKKFDISYTHFGNLVHGKLKPSSQTAYRMKYVIEQLEKE